MQKTSSTIGDVLPMLNVIISRWKRFDVPQSYRQLCFALIQAFEHKFDYEINSSIYAVAALFNVSKLHTWYNRTDCENIRTKAIGNMIDVNALKKGLRSQLKQVRLVMYLSLIHI